MPDSIITDVNTTKFLGLTIDNIISWKNHILDLTSKLNTAIRAAKPLMSLKALMMIYFSYFHSLMSYGIIFWGNCHASNDIFKLQKRIIRILTNKTRYDSCRSSFKQLQILTLSSQYIYSTLVFVIKNKELFVLNSEILNLNTRTKNNLHLPSVNLSMMQKGVLYSGSSLFNILPTQIKSLSDEPRLFKKKLKNFLLQHAFYSLDEFYQVICE